MFFKNHRFLGLGHIYLFENSKKTLKKIKMEHFLKIGLIEWNKIPYLTIRYAKEIYKLL